MAVAAIVGKKKSKKANRALHYKLLVPHARPWLRLRVEGGRMVAGGLAWAGSATAAHGARAAAAAAAGRSA